MNYADLSLEERIDMASDYVLLLMDDHLSEDQIVRELARQFSLSQNDALRAYAQTRTKHRQQFSHQQNHSIWKAVGAIFVSFLLAIFYFVSGEEIGWPFLLIAGFFLLGSFAAIVGTIERLMERLFFTPGMIQERLERSKRTGKLEKDWSIRLFTGALFFTFFTAIFYVKKTGVEDLSKVQTIHRLVLRQPVEATSKGNSYEFRFERYPHRFRLKADYLNFSNYQFLSRLLQPGDTIGIQVRNKDYWQYLQSFRSDEESSVDLLNLIIRAKPLVNWKARNEANRQKNELPFYILLGATVLSLLLVLIRHKLAAYRR